jgi:hypothetical protein
VMAGPRLWEEERCSMRLHGRSSQRENTLVRAIFILASNFAEVIH